MDELIIYLTPLLVVALCFLFNKRLNSIKSTADFDSSIKSEQYKAEVDYYNKKITQFLNPLISCIEFDNAIWEKLSMLSDADDVFSKNLSKEIEKEHLLKNLIGAKDLVRANLHYVHTDNDLYRTLIDFIRHVSVYESIRKSGEKYNPIHVGAPFPSELESFVKREYTSTISKYEELIQTPNRVNSAVATASADLRCYVQNNRT